MKYHIERLYKKDCGEEITKEEMHKYLLDILIAFDGFCRQHNLKYYLSGGTLLGAIRHKGFIPWDDDIDINMPRPECEKLQEISNGKIGDFIVVPPNYDSVYPMNFWRIYDNRIVIENSKGGTTTNYTYEPAFIDIFPIEGLPDNDKDTRKIFIKIKFNKKMLNSLKGWFHGKTIASKIFHLVARPVAELFGRKFWRNNIQKIASSISFYDSDYIGVVMTNVHSEEERVVKSEYTPQIDVEFEGRTFKAPAGYHQYLLQLYGDNYMELPPVEKRKSHHGFTVYKRK